MRKALTAAVLAFGLASCGDGDTPPPADSGNETAKSEDIQNRLEAMPEGQRNGVFIRAIRDSGEDCQHVESSSRAGEHEGYPVWTAACAGGGNFTIVITSGGVAQVLNDAERRLVGSNEPAPQNVQGE